MKYINNQSYIEYELVGIISLSMSYCNKNNIKQKSHLYIYIIPALIAITSEGAQRFCFQIYIAAAALPPNPHEDVMPQNCSQFPVNTNTIACNRL